MSQKIHVLLSGGSGSRLWPLSRKSRTKQFIPLFDRKSLFEIALENNRNLCDKVIVVGNLDNYKITLDEIKKKRITNVDIIVEATPKNTAAAVAFAALSVDPENILLVTPSDHVILNEVAYQKAIKEAFSLAEDNFLVTFGIVPNRAETGYGYIKYKDEDVLSFHEKPSKEKALEFLKADNFLWNSGMFCFKAGVFLDELKKFRPHIFDACEKVMTLKQDDFLNLESSSLIPSESIDYAVMEHSERIKVVKGDFYWSDLGSFESIFEYFKPNHPYIKDTNLIIAEDLHVEIQGLQNTMVIQSGKSILVMPINQSQEVKKIYERLHNEKRHLTD
uniref:mannose-1-phosphate guanylyltransferase n=1 Tax=Flavobacterium sp. TaxID=239 RepID=UPI00404931F3